MIKFCQHCGSTNDTVSQVCTACLDKRGLPRYCTNCGKPYVDPNNPNKHQCGQHEMRNFWTSQKS